MLKEKENTNMADYITLTGWYEVDEGCMNVHIEGHDLLSLVRRLREADPENFGYTDMELEVCDGIGDVTDVTDQVYIMVGENI